MTVAQRAVRPYVILSLLLVLTATVYAPGLGGGFVFDDFPNLINNPHFPPEALSPSVFLEAVFSSTAGPSGRPLSMLTFAFETYIAGLDPFILKLTNLTIHLANGALIFLLFRSILRATKSSGAATMTPLDENTLPLLVTGAWLLAPINLTGVLYVIQRMESLATLCILSGLLLFIHYRRRLHGGHIDATRGLLFSLGFWTPVGVLFKESAALLPLYAFVIEFVVFRFRDEAERIDFRVVGTFVLFLLVPMLAATAWVLPAIVFDNGYASRPFTLFERLLTETRVMWNYIHWILFPDLKNLSLYHDTYTISRGWLTPPTTLLSALGLAAVAFGAVALRRKLPLAALGIIWFIAGHTLTSTVIPLELVYEHRNYLPSAGLFLAFFSLLCPFIARYAAAEIRVSAGAILIAFFATLTLFRALTWSDPLTLALSTVENNPESARAHYDLGQTLHAMAQSPESRQFNIAVEHFKKAADLSDSGILPEQALIVVHAKHGLLVNPDWWTAIQEKLRKDRISPAVRNALQSLVDCHARKVCDSPESLDSTLSMLLERHDGNAAITTLYANFARNVAENLPLAYKLTQRAVYLDPDNGTYWGNLARVQIDLGLREEAEVSIARLAELNEIGMLSRRLEALQSALSERTG